MATIAPVVVSVALWLITSSVFALVFAALGPAVAIASLADARLQSRRTSRREKQRFAAETAAARADLVGAHDRERAMLAASAPSAGRLIDGGWSESEQWLGGLDEVVAVSIGRGDRPSGVVLDGMPAPSRAVGDHNDALRELAARARTVSDAPLVVDARLGLGFVGAPAACAATARSALVQVLATLPPASHRVSANTATPDWAWLDEAPHGRGHVDSVAGVATSRGAGLGTGAGTGAVAVAGTGAGTGTGTGAVPGTSTGTNTASVVRVTGPSGQLVVAVAPGRDDLPRAARIVVRVDGTRGRIEQHPDPSLLVPVAVELTSREQAAAVARRFSVHAAREGLVAGAELVDAVSFAECVDRRPGERGQQGLAGGHGQPGAPRRGLACTVAVAADGPVTIDLVEHGPHAVVGGTTGSGKSELLTAWVLALARSHSPRDASVLLVDFKGGSAFASLAALPHCVGVLTDLDEASAGRALQSLAAELRRRERHVAEAGAKSIDDLAESVDVPTASAGASGRSASAEAEGASGRRGSAGRLPRLVIVVDEFAAMVSGFPDLHGLFGDIAARGRSLGVHLILCTQRPAGVIRDAVLANSAIRISLRVNNRADSTAVIGTDGAAALPLSPRGRALISSDGDEPVLAQFPLVLPSDIEAVAALWTHDVSRPHRPWLDPLPPSIDRSRLRAPAAATEPGVSADAIPFGLLDDPANQSQPVALYRPAEHGSLLVLGGAGSGKSTLLASIAAGADGRVERAPQQVEGSWDALAALLAEIRTPAAALPERPSEAPPDRVVLLDDLDVVVARCGEDHESAVVDMLTQCLREGPARGIRFVLSAQRLTAALHPIAALCGSRLLLRLPSRQEHVLAGGDGQDYIERMPPGGGRWLGLRVQVAAADPEETHRARHAKHELSRRTTIDLARPLAVVSNRPGPFVDRLRRAFPSLAPAAITLIGGAPGATPDPAPAQLTVSVGARPEVIVGDVEAWQAQWGALAALRSTHSVVVDHCTVGEFRAVTRCRALPPPLAPNGEAFWVVAAEGGVVRGILPHH